MELTKYEKYEIVEINRKEIRNAPYNPRKISDKVRSKLKNNIKTIGLMSPITFNVRTGNIVSGHKRIEVLDTLEKNQDYKLKVAKVDLDEKTEKEQNIFMNNPEAQGEFDFQKLDEMLREDKVDFGSAGFELSTIYDIFGTDPLLQQPEQLEILSEDLRKTQNIYEGAKKQLNERDDWQFFLVTVFKSTEQKLAFIENLKQKGIASTQDGKYINGQDLYNFIGDSKL